MKYSIPATDLQHATVTAACMLYNDQRTVEGLKLISLKGHGTETAFSIILVYISSA
jgi:hypothetical protein